METKNFLWLVSREEVREMCPTWPKRKQTSNRGHQARYYPQELTVVPGQQIGGEKETSVLPLQGNEFYQQPLSSEKDSEPKS